MESESSNVYWFVVTCGVCCACLLVSTYICNILYLLTTCYIYTNIYNMLLKSLEYLTGNHKVTGSITVGNIFNCSHVIP